MTRTRWTLVLSLLMLACGLLAHMARAQQTPSRPVVYVVPVEGIIDLGLAPFVERVLNEAAQADAAAVVLDIDTFGGRVDAAVQIRDALLETKLRTVAFVNKRAISAGALIALSTRTIAMTPGGTIGAAAPVQAGAPGAAAMPVQEKTVSYVRKEFGATAEARGRPQLLAEAMVDADVEVPGVIDKGKLLTLTTDEALKHKVADFRADTLDGLLQQLDLAGADVRRPMPHWAEQLVRLLTHPVLSSLLISIGMVGILVELRTPGFGWAGGVGIGSLALFFYGHWLVQLAGWEELLLVALGLLLLAVEVFVIPGFGVVGALGILALLGGLTLSLVGAGATTEVIFAAVARIVMALVLALLGGLLLLRFFPRLPFARKLVLEADLGSGPSHGSAPETDQHWLGKQGRASSVLRPAGIAEFDHQRVDVVAEGVMIEAGEAIEVIRVDGNRIVVRRATEPPKEN
jgi:membrane-bound serine protease (ClpP class)